MLSARSGGGGPRGGQCHGPRGRLCAPAADGSGTPPRPTGRPGTGRREARRGEAGAEGGDRDGDGGGAGSAPGLGLRGPRRPRQEYREGARLAQGAPPRPSPAEAGGGGGSVRGARRASPGDSRAAGARAGGGQSQSGRGADVPRRGSVRAAWRPGGAGPGKPLPRGDRPQHKKKGRRKIKACFSRLKIPSMYTAGRPERARGALARRSTGRGRGLSSSRCHLSTRRAGAATGLSPRAALPRGRPASSLGVAWHSPECLPRAGQALAGGQQVFTTQQHWTTEGAAT